jgi:hypothetical protein
MEREVYQRNGPVARAGRTVSAAGKLSVFAVESVEFRETDFLPLNALCVFRVVCVETNRQIQVSTSGPASIETDLVPRWNVLREPG